MESRELLQTIPVWVGERGHHIPSLQCSWLWSSTLSDQDWQMVN